MTRETAYNLLSEPLLGVRSGSTKPEHVSLPELLERLGAGDAIEPTGLQAHQQHGWHAFVVQLAALALDSAGERRLDRRASEWRDLLLQLGGGSEEPWCLLVTDLARPALLQSPVPEGSLESFQVPLETPDDLDILVTTKNHDVKTEKLVTPQPEHWVYALATLQTSQGYSGRDNYGIARMNGGFASRVALAATPKLTWTARFARDVCVWLDSRPGLLDRDLGYRNRGLALLWLEPWDGTAALSPADCDPFFVEICRRIRLARGSGEDQRLVAYTKPTKSARLAASHLKGNLGDIWVPIRIADGAALTLGSDGFSYQRLQSILFESDFATAPALEVQVADGDEPWLIAQALVRGQGKTDGYRERLVPVPRRARSLLATAEGRARLGELARSQVERVATVRRRVLVPALCALLQGGGDTLDFRDPGARRWGDRLDDRVDPIFFESLWTQAETTPEEAQRSWTVTVLDLAEKLVDEAIRSMPLPSARYYRAVARARNLFGALARKHCDITPLPPANGKGEADAAART